MLKYASRFQITDQDMHLSELKQEGRERVHEMALRDGFIPCGATAWTVVEIDEGPELLGVTPVQRAVEAVEVKSAG
ncbi:hypothetical protein [Pseudarthrobacter siccitolerans]